MFQINFGTGGGVCTPKVSDFCCFVLMFAFATVLMKIFKTSNIDRYYEEKHQDRCTYHEVGDLTYTNEIVI